jgi:hypothetical protein
MEYEADDTYRMPLKQCILTLAGASIPTLSREAARSRHGLLWRASERSTS